MSAPHGFSWDGATLTGDSLFVLEIAGAGDGALKYTITVPQSITLGGASRIQVEVDGAVCEDLDDDGFTDGVHAISADETDVTVTLPGGRYTVDILLADDSGNTAVYRESVIILPGLATELAFAPDAADFLDPAVLAALTEVDFGPTAANTGGILVDALAGSPVSPALAIEAPAGTETVYFTMAKTAAHSVAIGGAGAALVSQEEFAEGSNAGDELAVFKADLSSLNIAEDSLVFDLTVTEQGKTGVTVTVTIAAIPGLYIDTGGGGAEDLTPVLDGNEDPIEGLQASLTWLAANAVSDTNYVVLINQDSPMTTFDSKTGVSGVRITLRGIGQ